MPELLLELFSEEIPARMQDRAVEALAGRLEEILFDPESSEKPDTESFATPRRLTVVIHNVPSTKPDQHIERRGPKVDAPPQAREGFIRSLGVSEYELAHIDEKKGRFILARYIQKGDSATEALSRNIDTLFEEFPWPRSMRWGSKNARWVRPLHSIVCLLDGIVVPFRFAGIESGAVTFGHRFLASDPISVRSFTDYKEKLYEAKVVLAGETRRKIIANEAALRAERESFRVKPDEGLLDELKGLVEWPVPLMGRIDEESMRLPPEVLTTSMRTHQRYLALLDADGNLAPRFITVANVQASDGGAAIIAGNERVLRARLWDARFFWDQDRKQPLDAFLPGLDQMVFHEKLGSQGERVERLVALADALAPHVPGADRAHAQRAAHLAKADLRSGMVGEFPELQGVMGGHYARTQNEPEPVARAIAEQYAPKGPDDACPTEPTSVVVALADKLDTLVGFFAAGIRPTGSKDPFALRRAALGCLRLIVENQLRIPLWYAFKASYEAYGTRFAEPEFHTVFSGFLEFFLERLRVYLRSEGIRHDVVSAVYQATLGPNMESEDVLRLIRQAEAVQEFISTQNGVNLLVAFRRANNIIRIEEKKDSHIYNGFPQPSLIQESAEFDLLQALQTAIPRIEELSKQEDYREAMVAVAELRASVDRFFDQVKVNAEEPELRVNRLLLLGLIRSALGRVADFGLIEDAGG